MPNMFKTNYASLGTTNIHIITTPAIPPVHQRKGIPKQIAEAAEAREGHISEKTHSNSWKSGERRGLHASKAWLYQPYPHPLTSSNPPEIKV